LKARAAASVEALWTSGFALAGRLLRPRVEAWSSPGGQRVLVLAPHPDDEVIGCAGTIARHVHAGDDVHIVIITDGRQSRALDLGPDEMARRRRQEAELGSQSLSARLEWLGLPEDAWQPEQLQAALHSLFQEWRPHLVYAPSRIDFHPEHLRVAQALAAVLGDYSNSRLRAIRVYPVQVPLTPVLTNLVTPLADVMPQVSAALGAYVTQQDNMGRAMRQRRYAAHLYGLRGGAEELWQMSPEQYARLHASPEPASTSTFRGVRGNAWSDPLAYLTGVSARRAARAAGSPNPVERVVAHS
jgi:LmbE family N-acetylglucosaminyl deacetylase